MRTTPHPDPALFHLALNAIRDQLDDRLARVHRRIERAVASRSEDDWHTAATATVGLLAEFADDRTIQRWLDGYAHPATGDARVRHRPLRLVTRRTAGGSKGRTR